MPGVGNAGRLRIRMRREVIATLAPTMKGQKIDLEHHQDIENEVGFVPDAFMQGDRFRGVLRFQATRPKFLDAIGFIEGRRKAGVVPEVSVEFKDIVVRAATPQEQPFFDLDLLGGRFAGVALVTRGACAAGDGCGIFLAFADEPTGLAQVIPAPSAVRFSEASWEALGLGDFTDSSWEDLADGERRRIASHYLVTLTMNPPDAFGDLKFPYREPVGGAVNVNALRAILGGRGSQADLPADVRDRAQSVARGLLERFNESREAGASADPNGSSIDGDHFRGEGTSMCNDPECAKRHARIELDAAEAEKGLDAALKEAEASKARVKELEGQLGAAAKTIEAYLAAERTALLEALEKAAPKGTNLADVLGGVAPKDAPLNEIRVALKMAQSLGVRQAPEGGGRHTIPTKRDDRATDPASFLEAKRAQLGLKAAEDGKRESPLPLPLRRNTERLLRGG